MKCKDIISAIENLCPVKYAESWDNVGLLTGREEKEVGRIMIALDATKQVVNQAIEENVDMLITHHPMIFSSLKKVVKNDFIGEKIISLVQHDISYYAMHTNFDTMAMADAAAEKLGLINTRPLQPSFHQNLYKIMVYVPTDHADQVRDAMTRAGAGFTGNYSNCTFNIEGMGTFYPLEGTNPYIGKQNELCRTPEIKIETVSTEEKVYNIVNAMLKVHPYEEPAYDIFLLHNQGKTEGIGRYGYFVEELSLSSCARMVKEKFGLDYVRVVGNMDRRIAKAAVCPGAGKSMIKDAQNCGAEVYITGDIDHHTALDAAEQGLSIIDAGHFGTESFMKEYVKNYLQDYIYKSCHGLEELAIITATENNPFQLV